MQSSRFYIITPSRHQIGFIIEALGTAGATACSLGEDLATGSGEIVVGTLVSR